MAEMIIYKILARNPEEKRHLEDLGIERIGGILKWDLKKQEERLRTGFIWLRTGASRGRFLCINATYVSILCSLYFCMTVFVNNWKSLQWNGLRNEVKW
jgi:hypothetical protein